MERQRTGYMTATTAYLPKLLQSTNASYRGDTKTVEISRFKYLYTTASTFSPNTAATGFFGTSSSYPLVTFEENKLIAAEANLKIATPDEAAALSALNSVRSYHNGGGRITASLLVSGEYKYDPYVLTDFDAAGIQNSAGSYTRNQALLREILEEKYITLIGQIEQFNDVRRTKNILGITPISGASLPQRLLYPQSEINSNPNTPVQTTSSLYTATTVNATAY
jgi:hypothetical protein